MVANLDRRRLAGEYVLCPIGWNVIILDKKRLRLGTGVVKSSFLLPGRNRGVGRRFTQRSVYRIL